MVDNAITGLPLVTDTTPGGTHVHNSNDHRVGGAIGKPTHLYHGEPLLAVPVADPGSNHHNEYNNSLSLVAVYNPGG